MNSLPVEIISDIHLLALAPSFPHTCRYIYNSIKLCSPHIHALYICARHAMSFSKSVETNTVYVAGKFLSEALRYPICTVPVLECVLRIAARRLKTCGDAMFQETDQWTLPRCLFRHLNKSDANRGLHSEPLPLLRYLWEKRGTLDFAKPSANSNRGYPLVRAVHSQFIPLIIFLLEHGANPAEHDALAIRIAIGIKDIQLVRLLIEVEPEINAKSKKRRREDRVRVTPALLDVAAKVDARDIVRYFIDEKGCVPNMKTLNSLHATIKPE